MVIFFNSHSLDSEDLPQGDNNQIETYLTLLLWNEFIIESEQKWGKHNRKAYLLKISKNIRNILDDIHLK